MKLTVFGATGGTGREIVLQALAAGHDVTAAVRRPDALGLTHERLTVVAADVMRPETLAEAVTGREAVFSALGIGMKRHATTLYSAGTGAVAAAMRDAGVPRLVVVSTSGLSEGAGMPALQWLVVKGMLQPMLRKPYADMAQMERIVEASGLDWTIVRAARLTDGPRTGRARVAYGVPLRGAWSLSRADLAHCLLDRLNDPASVRARVDAAY